MGLQKVSATVSLAGTIRMQDMRSAFGVGMLRSAVGTPELGGQVSVKITELKLADNWPQDLIATAELNNLSSPMMGRGESGRIGNLVVNFDSSTATDKNLLVGEITDAGGPLEINGSLTLQAPQDYSLKARIKARPSAPESLQSNLEFLGAPEADGTRIFQFAGSI